MAGSVNSNRGHEAPNAITAKAATKACGANDLRVDTLRSNLLLKAGYFGTYRTKFR
jgi:hypothetical protein